MPHREGFLCAGSWYLEHVKTIARYPALGTQATILREHTQAGGSAFNMLAALRRRDANVPLYALGMLGDDEEGRMLLAACHKQEADTFQLEATSHAPTAHAFVMHSEIDQAQTRFYSPAANLLLQCEHFAFKHCLASWLHLSDYEALSGLHRNTAEEALDKILRAAHTENMTTAMTLLLPEYAPLIRTALPLLDFLILSTEAWQALREQTNPASPEAEFLLQHGIRRGCVVIGEERVWALLGSGEYFEHKFSETQRRNRSLDIAEVSASFLYSQYAAWNLAQLAAAIQGR